MSKIFARLYRPTYTKPVPKAARVVTIRGVAYARWKQRGGREVTAKLSADRKRCTVQLDTWWCKWKVQGGPWHLEECYRDRTASEAKRLEILTREERRAAGAPLPAPAQDRVTVLAELADAWERHLLSRGSTGKYVRQAARRVRLALGAMRAVRPADLAAPAVEDYLARMATEGENMRGERVGWAVETRNHVLTHLKGFSRFLVDRGHLDRDPLARLRKRSADAHRTFERRALTDPEFWALIDTTARDPKAYRNLPGPDRAMCYLTAAFTGLRLNELATLTPDSFQPRGDQYLVLLPGRAQKNRKELPAFLPSAAAARLRPYLAGKPAGERLWDRGTWARTAQATTALYRDLAAAGVPVVDAAGKRFDFHALRSHYITTLLLRGVPVPQAQRLARLSDPRTLMRHYAKLGLDDLAAQAEKLNPPPSPADLPRAKKPGRGRRPK